MPPCLRNRATRLSAPKPLRRITLMSASARYCRPAGSYGCAKPLRRYVRAMVPSGSPRSTTPVVSTHPPSLTSTVLPASTQSMSLSSSEMRNPPVHLIASLSPLLLQTDWPELCWVLWLAEDSLCANAVEADRVDADAATRAVGADAAV